LALQGWEETETSSLRTPPTYSGEGVEEIASQSQLEVPLL